MNTTIQRWNHQVDFSGVYERAQAERIESEFWALVEAFVPFVASASVVHEGGSVRCLMVGLYDAAVLKLVTKRVSAFGHDQTLAPGDVFINAWPAE